MNFLEGKERLKSMMNERNDIADNQKIIAELRAIVNAETEKPVSEQDIDLIKECVDFFMELDNRKELTPEQIAESKRIVMQRSEENNPFIQKTGNRRGIKVLLSAACFAIILMIASITAIAFNIDGAAILKSIEERLRELLPGQSVEYQGETIIQAGKSVVFKSVDDFVSEGSWEVLYPAKWPEGTELSMVNIIKAMNADNTLSGEYVEILFATNEPSVNMDVNTNPDADKWFLNSPDLIKENINGYDCHITNDGYAPQCYFVHNNCVYSVNAQNMDDIRLIINNIKEKQNNE